MIKTIFFDMDGTLIDTELAASKAIQESFREWGIAITADDSGFITGRTWEKAFEYLFKKYPLPVSPEIASQTMMSRYRAEVQRELIEVPGAVACVKSLSGEFPLALISGSHRAEIIYALDRLGILKAFEVILGAEDYPSSKPAPDGYLKALQLMNAKADETLVFEDSEAGIESGLRAGLHVCAITSTNHFGLPLGKAHLEVEDLRGVTAAWVKGLKLSKISG